MNSKTLLTTIYLLVISLLAHGQDINREFGQITYEELQMENYSKDPESGAVILFDIGKSFFIDSENGFDIRFTRSSRIKIFDKSGFDFAEISIPYYQDGYGKTEIIREIEAYTYNYEDGSIKKTPLDLENVFTEKVSETWNREKFAMPDVREGSVIEFRYVIESPFKYNLPDWTFQDRIPTIYSEYEVSLIPFYEYVFLLQGASRFDKQESFKAPGTRYFSSLEYETMVHQYIMTEVPAFKDESFITSIEDFIIKIDFQLAKIYYPDGREQEIITTWPKLCTALLKHPDFGKYIKASTKIGSKNVLQNLNLDGKSDLEKFESIVNYVKANFSWNKRYSRYTHQSAKEFFDSKSGSSIEINLFLVGILNSANIVAHPLLISTRDHGKIKGTYPFEHFFNNAIVIVTLDGKSYLTDATMDNLPFSRIPHECINDRGLIIQDDGENWVELTNPYYSTVEKSFSLDILPGNDSLTFEISINLDEYDAFDIRNRLVEESDFIQQEVERNNFTLIGSIETKNIDKINLPVSISYKGEKAMETFDGNLYISPFLNEPMSENPFKYTSREYPIDMIYKKARKFRSIINIPEEYSLKLPENQSFNDDEIEYSYRTYRDGHNLIVEGFYFLKNSVYPASDYKKLKYHFNQIIKLFNQQIEIVKNIN